MAKSIARYLADVASPSGVVDGTLSTAAQTNVTSLGTLSSLVIADGGNIGSASDTDAISISSGGVVTMNQIPVLSAGLNVSGGSIAGTLSTAAQTNITSLGTLTGLTVSGNVGIGNARTDGTLHVLTASAGTVAASTQADDLVIENNAEGGMTIITPDNESARIRFTSPSTNTDVGGAHVFYRQNINKMQVGTAVSGGVLSLASGASNDTMILDGSGNVGIGTGSSTIAFSAGNGLRVENASTATLRLQDTGSHGFEIRAHADAAQFYNANNKPYIFYDSSNNDILHITNAGNVGIGVPTPDQKLMVKGTIESVATNSANGWQLYTYTDNTFRINYNGSGADELVLDTSGRLKFGDAPQTSNNMGDVKLQFGSNYAFGGAYSAFGETLNSQTTIVGNNIRPVIGTNNQVVRHYNGSDAGNFMKIAYNKGFTFHTGITTTQGTGVSEDTNERMRIDTSGNLLVGTTDASQYNNASGADHGIVLAANNYIDISRNGNPMLYLNRTDSDGQLAYFSREGSGLGTIAGRTGGSQYYMSLETTTSDGSDHSQIALDAGSGAGSTSRGAFFSVYGNERSGFGGNIYGQTGASGSWIFATGSNADQRVVIDGNGQTTMTRSDNGQQLTLKSTDNDAGEGPVLDMFRDAADGVNANSDLLGTIRFLGNDTVGQSNVYARIKSQAVQADNGAEDGALMIHAILNGTDYEVARFGGSLNPDLAMQSSVGQIIGGFGAVSTSSSSTNWNNAINARSGNGYTLLQGNHSNGPTAVGDYWHVFTFEYASRDGDGNMTQIAIPYAVASGTARMRSRYVGTWSSWITF